jgi:hypothetical protein
MTRSLADHARARRRAALSALNARLVADNSVISIFGGSFPRRQAVPEFRSVRRHSGPPAAQVLPVLVLRQRVAA